MPRVVPSDVVSAADRMFQNIGPQRESTPGVEQLAALTV
jgi:hypothetical protein